MLHSVYYASSLKTTLAMNATEPYLETFTKYHLNVSELNLDMLPKYHFTVADYAIFGVMLLVSAATGLYHGLRGRKNLTTRKYLMGSDMQVIPVAFSLIAR